MSNWRDWITAIENECSLLGIEVYTMKMFTFIDVSFKSPEALSLFYTTTDLINQGFTLERTGELDLKITWHIHEDYHTYF